jgi:hypothetical protein
MTRAGDERSDKKLVLGVLAVASLIILIAVSGVVQSVSIVDGFPFVRVQVSGPALLAANTPAGGDMGAHVLLPQYLKDTLLPDGRLFGWSMDWYAGFPAGYFYFPLPALAIVALDTLLPYGVAFKLVTMAGLVALPWAAYYLLRSLGFARVVAALAAAFSSTYVFMESFSIYGANIKSTFAGEYSFSWSVALSLVYAGMLVRDIRDDRGFTVGAGVMLGLTALTHIVTTMLIVLITLPLIVRRGGAKVLVRSWAIGFGLSAIWALPLGIRVLQGMTTDMGWNPVTGLIGETGSPGVTATAIPGEFFPVLALAVIGAVWTLLRRDDVMVLMSMALIPLGGYVALGQVLDFTKLYNGRLLPYWFLAGYLFAGLAIGLAVRSLARALPDRRRNLVAGSVVAVVLIGNVTLAAVHDVPGWVRWNYTGYESKEAWPEYQAILETLDQLPPGRVMWEPNSEEMGKYGSPLAFMLFPYWTGEHPSMEGLFFESSLTTPFHFLNASAVAEQPSNPVRGLDYPGRDMERAVAWLGMYGVDYLAAWSDETKQEAADLDLPEVAASGPVTFFRLPESPLVEVASRQPAVYAGDLDFVDASLEWYDDWEGMGQWLVEDGPDTWPRTGATTGLDDIGAGGIGAPVTTEGVVSDIVIEDERISFTTTAVGEPHLVRVSYFPAWRATGADGPYRAAPSLMVVVPTEEHVVLEFANGVPENVGLVLTLLTLAGVLAYAVRRRDLHRDEHDDLTAAPPGDGR